MNEHSAHEKMTEIFNDYQCEPPDDYADIFDDQEFERQRSIIRKEKKDEANS